MSHKSKPSVVQTSHLLEEVERLMQASSHNHKKPNPSSLVDSKLQLSNKLATQSQKDFYTGKNAVEANRMATLKDKGK